MLLTTRSRQLALLCWPMGLPAASESDKHKQLCGKSLSQTNTFLYKHFYELNLGLE